jgi:hypothetical protein
MNYEVSVYEHDGRYYMQGALFVREITKWEYENYKHQATVATSRFVIRQEIVKDVEVKINR